MDGTLVAIGLSAVATLGAVYNGYRQNRNSQATSEDEGSRNRLELAFEMQEKQIDRLVKADDAKTKQIQLLEERNLHTDRQLQECKDGHRVEAEIRHQLEIQVEILKLQVGGGHGSGK